MLSNVRSQYIEEIINITRSMSDLLNKAYTDYTIYDDIEYYRLMSEKEKYEEYLDKLF